jgi:hypothetical protein
MQNSSPPLPQKGTWDAQIISRRMVRSVQHVYLLQAIARFVCTLKIPFPHRSLFADAVAALCSFFNGDIVMDIATEPSLSLVPLHLPQTIAPPPAVVY